MPEEISNTLGSHDLVDTVLYLYLQRLRHARALHMFCWMASGKPCKVGDAHGNLLRTVRGILRNLLEIKRGDPSSAEIKIVGFQDSKREPIHQSKMNQQTNRSHALGSRKDAWRDVRRTHKAQIIPFGRRHPSIGHGSWM